jgi:hypothetical protein
MKIWFAPSATRTMNQALLQGNFGFRPPYLYGCLGMLILASMFFVYLTYHVARIGVWLVVVTVVWFIQLNLIVYVIPVAIIVASIQTIRERRA